MIRYRSTRPLWLRSLGAILLVAFAAAIRSKFLGALEGHAPFVLSYPPVIVAALCGGFSAGVVATVFAAFLSSLWLEPIGSFFIAAPVDWVAIGIFVVSGILISYLCDMAVQAQARADEAEKQARLALEQEQAAARLRESEERFRTLADNISQLAWMTDANGWIFWYNKRWFDYTGTSLEEMQGWGWKKLHDPDHLERVVERFQHSLKTGEPWEDLFPLRGKDGRYRWFLSRALPIREETGRIVRWFGTNTDVTEQREAEAALRLAHDELELRVRERTAELQKAYDALRQNEAKYRELVENANSIILRFNSEGKITFFNEFAQEFFGFTEAEILGRAIVGTIVPEVSSSGQDLAALIRGITNEPERYLNNENENMKRNGERVWVSWTNKAVFDDAGAPVGVLSIGNDITERKRSEMALSRANLALRTLSECNEALVRNKDEAELLAHVTRILVETGGYRMAWVGYVEPGEERRIRPVASAGHVTGYLEFVETTLMRPEAGFGPGGTAIRTQKPYIVRDVSRDPRFGLWRKEALERGYRSMVSIPLLSEDEAFGTLSIYADEPDVFDAEEMKLLVSLADDLSFGIGSIRLRAERESAEEQLRIYTARLERQNRELADFTFISSHHVQEPLRKILTFSDLLTNKCSSTLDAEACEMLERMQKSARRMQALVRDLLRYSRINTESEEFAPVDLTRVVQGVLASLDPAIRETGLQVDLAPLPSIEADGKQMRKLFQHLIDNAVKFRGKNPLRVRISAEMHRGGRNGAEHLDITVEDNGIGFDEKYVDRIFTPFQQLHVQGRYEGTGMGLAICRRIVERHHGAITARSAPGEGATFIVSLPIHQDKEEEDL